MVYDSILKLLIIDFRNFVAEASPAPQCTREELKGDPGCQSGVLNQRERLLNYKEASIYLEVYIL